MKTLLTVYLGSAFLAMILTPLIIFIARRVGIVDIPDVRKVHFRPIPRIGGIAIFVPMMVLTVSVLFLDNTIGEKFRDIQTKVIVLLGAGTFIFFMGLIDDIKGLRARIKLLCQLTAAITVCGFGIRITSVAISDRFILNLGWFSWPLTLLWIVGVTNAINLVDGLDGLSAGICAIACGAMAILSIHFAQPIMTVIMLSLVGALTGFLFFNFNPAKIFMGDSGSLFLGFILASASVMSAAKSQAIVGLTLPILVLGIPIFDTLFSMLHRFLERRSIFSPDRNHFHHKLLVLGLRQRHVIIVAYAVTLLVAMFGMFMMFTRNIQTIIIFICILLLIVMVFRVIGSVKLQETIEGLQRKYTITNQIKQERENFEKAQLHFCQARSFDQWWQSVCLAAEHMNFKTLSMSVTNRDGTRRILTWKDKRGDAESQDLLRMVVPIIDRRVGPPLKLEVGVHTNGSLESAGRRGALFSRLIEEHGIKNLRYKSEYIFAHDFIAAKQPLNAGY